MVVKMEKEINESEEDEDVLKFAITLFTIIFSFTAMISIVILNSNIDRDEGYGFEEGSDCYYCDDDYYNETFVIRSLRYTLTRSQIGIPLTARYKENGITL